MGLPKEVTIKEDITTWDLDTIRIRVDYIIRLFMKSKTRTLKEIHITPHVLTYTYFSLTKKMSKFNPSVRRKP